MVLVMEEAVELRKLLQEMVYIERDPYFSTSKPDGAAVPVQAAKILRPGAITSGLRISGVVRFRPRLENEVTLGAESDDPITVPLNTNDATGI